MVTPCITPSVVLHVFVRRSQILFTFNRHQVMYSVFPVVSCVVDTCKGLFLIQKGGEEQGQWLVFNNSQQFFGHMFHFRVYNYNFYCFLISQLCYCYADLELSARCMINFEKHFSVNHWMECYEIFFNIGGWSCNGNKLKCRGW